MIKKDKKQELIVKFRKAANDVGSSAVQVGILTARMKELSEHFKTNPKDHASRRGFLMLISKRKRLLAYVKRHKPVEYQELLKKIENTPGLDK